MKATFINPKEVKKLPLPAAHGAVLTPGKLVAVCGQIPTDVDGNVVGEGDIKAQTRQVLDNIVYVLKDAGATLADVFKINVYLTDISQIGEVLEVRREYFTQSTPISTAVEVSALVRKELLVEIEAMAMLDA